MDISSQIMAKTKRVRVKIIKMLQRFGELDTASIYDQLNATKGEFSLRHGCTMQTLGNVLSKEPVFVKMADTTDDDAPRFQGTNGYSYKIASWDLDRGLLSLHPELASENTNSWQLRSAGSAH